MGTPLIQCTRTLTLILLQTARAIVYNPNQPHLTTEVRLILDSGSQRSYVTDKLKHTLALEPLYTENMLIKTFGATDKRRQMCPVLNLGVITKCESNLELHLLVVPTICEPLSQPPTIYAMQNFHHLAGLELADSSCYHYQLELDILIGLDHYWKITTREVVRGKSGPTAIGTSLGWVLSGPIDGMPMDDSSVYLSVYALQTDVQTVTQSLDSQLKMFWELESLGIANEESSVYDKFIDTIDFRNGRYEVHLPWRDEYVILPDNYDLSRKR